MARFIKDTKESSGNFIRIYFCFAPEEGKIIASRIGKHKANHTAGVTQRKETSNG